VCCGGGGGGDIRGEKGVVCLCRTVVCNPQKERVTTIVGSPGEGEDPEVVAGPFFFGEAVKFPGPRVSGHERLS